jgi:hypothetical protein
VRPAYVRQLAAELEMISGGSTQAFNPAGGAGVPGSRPPSGDAHPPHLMFLAEWDRRGDVVLEKWLAELKRWKGQNVDRSNVKEETREQRDKRIVDTGEGLSLKEAALKYRCAERDVITARLADERHSATGKKLDLPSDAAQRARVLVDAGMSYRATAEKLRTHANTVVRWVKAA